MEETPSMGEVIKFAEVLRVLYQVNDPLEAEESLGIDPVDYLNLMENNVGRLEGSVDRILVRFGAVYLQLEGYGGLGTLDFDSRYIQAFERIQGLNHERSGDIVLILRDRMMEGSEKRYSTGTACKSWHGSLNGSDSYVPLIVSYPGGNRYEMEPAVKDTNGCSLEGCDGNRRISDLIKTIIIKQYTSE